MLPLAVFGFSTVFWAAIADLPGLLSFELLVSRLRTITTVDFLLETRQHLEWSAPLSRRGPLFDTRPGTLIKVTDRLTTLTVSALFALVRLHELTREGQMPQ